jgi:hypothetical protein
MFSILFVIGYITLIFIGTPEAGPHWAPVFNSVIAALFVSLFVLVSHGKVWFALTVVAVFTFVLPITVLFLIGWGSYPSILAQAQSILSAFSHSGRLWGLEIFSPLVFAWLVTFAISKVTSPNPSFKRDA